MKQAILKMALILSVPLFIVATITYFLFDTRISGLAYRLNFIPQDPYGFTSPERYKLSSIITTAIKQSDSPGELRKKLEVLPDITQKEIQHLIDVWLLFLWIIRMGLLSLGLLSFAIFLWYKTQHQYLLESIRRGAFLTVILLAVVIILTLFDWTRVFFHFHEVLFTSDSYSFPQDSLLIRLYPEFFWQLFAMIFMGLSLLVCISLLIITRKDRQLKVDKTGNVLVPQEN